MQRSKIKNEMLKKIKKLNLFIYFPSFISFFHFSFINFISRNFYGVLYLKIFQAKIYKKNINLIYFKEERRADIKIFVLVSFFHFILQLYVI